MVNQIGIMGLGRMGGQIARRLHARGFEVVAWNRSPGPREEFAKFALRLRSGSASVAVATPEELINQLTTEPRIVWLMLPASTRPLVGRGGPSGELVDEKLKELDLASGDIVIDGGNSFYRDSQRRAGELKKRGVHFFDCGTSGGVWGERNGFSLMVGGPKEAWPRVEPVFAALAAPSPQPLSPQAGRGIKGEGSYALLGPSGAGHFVKMVHNGIEYGMMEAIAEGFAVLNASKFKLDLAQVAGIWQKGSVVSSWLVELAKNALETENFSKVVGYIHATGEGEWTVQTAKKLGIDARVIADAFRVRQESSDPKNQEKFSNKIVALLRKQFGGHPVRYK